MESSSDILKKDIVEDKPDLPSFLKEVDFDKFKPQWGTMVNGFTLPQYTLTYNGIPFAPLDGIHALTGQSGHGKTMTFSILMAAILNGEYMGLEWNLPEIEPSVLYIDTEMEMRNTMMVISRVHSMCGTPINVDREDFRWLNLRDVEKAEDRWNYVTVAIETFRPTVTFLDGNLDLVNDFNDNQQCQEHIRRCMQVATYYKSSIWCLVHENPGSTKMVGHLGSMLERKVTDLLATKKNKDKNSVTPIFEVEALKTRGRDIPTIRFSVEQDALKLGVPVIIDALKGADEEKKEEGIKGSPAEIFPLVMQPSVKYSQNELINLIKPKLRIGTPRLRDFIDDGVKCGVLEYSSFEIGKKTLHQYTLIQSAENLFTNEQAGEDVILPF